MNQREKKAILRLLRGESTAPQLAAELGIKASELEKQRRAYLESKLPRIEGAIKVPGAGKARVRRDRWGVVHVEADRVEEGYFALGFAMGQDRLWQLDYYRRRARGRLAEVMGRRWLGSDRLLRTVGLARAAEQAVAQAPEEVMAALGALARGINAAAEQARDNLPVEFELLGYEPEEWRPVDSVAVWKWRWWMLTGRHELIALGEACKRLLPEKLRAAFLEIEAGEETLVPGQGGAMAGGHELGEGSNNWVVGASRSQSGRPVLATDPHNALDHPSQWYEAHLKMPGIEAIGAFYLGIPGVYLGHTRRAAWGLTNHFASARDLYAEEVRGDRYLEKGEWLPLEIEVEEVGVRREKGEKLEIRRTARGPLFGEFVPEVVEGGNPPLALKWAGAGPETGFEAMLELLRANSVGEVLQALEKWPFPNLNFVFADAEGRIGFHVAGTVPRRRPDWVGFRPAAEEEHQWNGKWSFAELPQLIDPERDWVGTANNPPWPGKGPGEYNLLGHWSDGYRFRRIRETIEGKGKMSREEVAALHADVLHSRARELAGVLAKKARQSKDAGVRQAAEVLEGWDGSYGVEEMGPAIFEAFWYKWRARVARQYFPEHLLELAVEKAGAVAKRLLLGQELGWFAKGKKVDAEIEAALVEGLDWLKEVAGEDRRNWRWGKLHWVRFPHPLEHESPALEELLSPGPFPTSGGSGTVRAAGFSAARPFCMESGSTYRMVVDMAHPERAFSTTTGGCSGHPGSPHYADQTPLWLADEYHPLNMDVGEEDLEGTLVLEGGE
jgi:penicillin amidase